MLAGVVGDRFEIDRLAGEGGMGAVYRAWDRAEGTIVALKVLRSDSGLGLARFAREARLLSELNHPGIVRLLAEGTLPSGEPFLAMEWLEGESLSERLKREVLTMGETLTVGRRIAEALAVAHDCGVVHRDLKPGNVFLVDRSLERVKVLDFGIARVSNATRQLTSTESMMGTPGYMAPEQMRSSRTAGPSADVYSLGCVIFRCLAGRTPFVGDNALELIVNAATGTAPRLRSLRSDVPEQLDAAVAGMLQSDPERRPANGRAASQLLQAVVDSQSPSPSSEPPTSTLAHGAQPIAKTQPMPASALPQLSPARGGITVAATPASTPQLQPFHPTVGTMPADPALGPPAASPTVRAEPAKSGWGLIGWLLALAGLALVAVAGLGIGLFVWLGSNGASADTKTRPAGGSRLPGGVPCPVAHCEPLRLPNPARTELLALLPRAKAIAKKLQPKTHLQCIDGTGLVDGRLDFSDRSTAVFTYADDRPGKVIWISVAQGQLMATRATHTHRPPLPDPGCNGHRAWRTAVAHGLGAREVVSIHYDADPHQPGRTSWVIHSADARRSFYMDGRDCRLIRKR